jgi:hypothetical protein
LKNRPVEDGLVVVSPTTEEIIAVIGKKAFVVMQRLCAQIGDPEKNPHGERKKGY